MMKKRNNLRIIIATVVVVIAAVSIYAFREFNRTNPSLKDLNADYTAKATDLITEFEKDEKTSDKKYLDKVIEVSGQVKEIKQDERGFYTIALGDTTDMSSVRCSMDSLYSDQAKSLSAGQPVIIKGVCTGFNEDELLGSDIILNRSIIKK
jgi:hypothetical protein